MTKQRWQDVVILLSGAATVLAFAPFNVYPLAIALPAILFFFWSTASPGRAAWLGFLFGMGLFGAGASWVYVSIHEFGFMPAPMAAFFVLLFVGYLSLFPAAAGWLQGRISGPGYARLLFAAPVSWVLAEWLRGWLLTGFPWLHLGYSQSDSVLMNIAPLAGVYGMSLVVAILAALLAVIIHSRGNTRYTTLAVLAVLLVGSWLAGQLDFVRPDGERTRLALVQGNVPFPAIVHLAGFAFQLLLCG